MNDATAEVILELKRQHKAMQSVLAIIAWHDARSQDVIPVPQGIDANEHLAAIILEQIGVEVEREADTLKKLRDSVNWLEKDG